MRIHSKRLGRTVLKCELLEDRTVPSAVSAFAADRLLVTFADVAPSAKAMSAIGSPTLAKSVTSLGLGIYRVDLAAGVDFQKAITIFSAQRGVESVARDAIVSVAQTPNDPRLGEQWSLTKISAAQGWNTTTGTGQTIVAVIDTGVDYTHPDLAANIWINVREIAGNGRDDDFNGYIDDVRGYDFSGNDANPMDETGHGTHVAGIVGATGNNGVGVTGVNQRAKIMALRFMDSNGNGYTSDAVRAIDYAIRNGAKILNNSWGGSTPDPTLAAAIERARAAGVIVVVAAGNETANNDTTASYPAEYGKQSNNVVAVASTGSGDRLSYFSNWGAQTVKLAAPGESILSTALGGGYVTKTGTSMATPVISGALALLWDLHPTWTYSQILAKLNTSVDAVSGLSGIVSSGGRINLAKLLDAPSTVPPVTVPPVTQSPPAITTPALRWGGSGPKVVSAIFGGANATSFSTVRVTFDKKMNALTFTPSDVVLTGPNGRIAVATVTVVPNSNNSIFEIGFAIQTAAGIYSVSIGPDVWDVQAKRMDQNGNGIGNEAADRSTTSDSLGTSAPPPAPAIPPATTNRKTYAAAANNVPILDGRTTRIRFGVTDAFSVSDLAVNLDLAHGRMTDLHIRLRSPDGRTVDLFNRRSLTLAGISFDDAAATSLASNSLSAGVKVRPEQALSGFAGKAAKGTWTLEIFDLFAGQTGTVKSASLSFGTAAAKAVTSGFTQLASIDHSAAIRTDSITVKSKA